MVPPKINFKRHFNLSEYYKTNKQKLVMKTFLFISWEESEPPFLMPFTLFSLPFCAISTAYYILRDVAKFWSIFPSSHQVSNPAFSPLFSHPLHVPLSHLFSWAPTPLLPPPTCLGFGRPVSHNTESCEKLMLVKGRGEVQGESEHLEQAMSHTKSLRYVPGRISSFSPYGE